MENLNNYDRIREHYRSMGRVQQYLRTKKILYGQLCFDSNIEGCDHDYCRIVWDILGLLKAPACIACYEPACICEDLKNKRNYPDDE